MAEEVLTLMARTSARLLATGEVTVSSNIGESTPQDVAQLYEPVPQISVPESMTLQYLWIDPQDAQRRLNIAKTANGFRQRTLDSTQVHRWEFLQTTKRFVHFLPNGPLCEDDDGVLLNGQHRLNGIVRSGQTCGFLVFSHVPVWMFRYFDTNKHRSVKDVLTIGKRPFNQYTPSTLRLAVRYEEFLRGYRNAYGWRHWQKVSTEHQDLDAFYERRPDLYSWAKTAKSIYSTSKIIAPAVSTFAFYQSLAWPEGEDELQDFLTDLRRWRYTSPRQPAKVLADWAYTSWQNKDSIVAKREVHLSQLMHMFTCMMQETRVHTILWAYGNPMPMPYHPQGPEVATKNVCRALDDMDEIYRKSH